MDFDDMLANAPHAKPDCGGKWVDVSTLSGPIAFKCTECRAYIEAPHFGVSQENAPDEDPHAGHIDWRRVAYTIALVVTIVAIIAWRIR